MDRTLRANERTRIVWYAMVEEEVEEGLYGVF
jgi:hypothetical protein